MERFSSKMTTKILCYEWLPLTIQYVVLSSEEDAKRWRLNQQTKIFLNPKCMVKKSAGRNMTNFAELGEKAMQIAIKVHSGQTDKGGNDYIYHPIRVSESCNSDEEKIVALLHDAIEDGDITADYLLMQGFPHDIVDAVLSVTRKKREDYFDFIQRCNANPIGRKVKLSDIKDNMGITRLKELTDNDIERLKKYHKAYKILAGK